MRMPFLAVSAALLLGILVAVPAHARPSRTPLNYIVPGPHIASLDSIRHDIDLAGAPALGDSAAPVTIVEFADFECTYCVWAAAWVDSIRQEWPHGVRIVYEQFPAQTGGTAELASEAAYAAHAQGAFWKMHDLMYGYHGTLDRETLVMLAGIAGLDRGVFTAALADHRYRPRVEHDVAEGKRLGVDGTPTFFVNGREYLGTGVRTMTAIRPFIESQIAAARAPSHR